MCIRDRNAKVVAVSATTNIPYETTTNSTGEYHLYNIHPGNYRIEIEKAGFKKVIKRDVIVQVQDALQVDLEITVGDVSETVTVDPGTSLLNTESGTVSTVVNRTFVENLPLNGRTFQTLISLTPGVVVVVTNQFDQGQF